MERMSKAQRDAIYRMTIDLYRNMPGAPRPPTENGSYLWGDVEGNQSWEFCEAIARQIVLCSGSTFVEDD